MAIIFSDTAQIICKQQIICGQVTNAVVHGAIDKIKIIVKKQDRFTFWINFVELCKEQNISPENVREFIAEEVQGTCSIYDGMLILCEYYQCKHLSDMFLKYLDYVKVNDKEYVEKQ